MKINFVRNCVVIAVINDEIDRYFYSKLSDIEYSLNVVINRPTSKIMHTLYTTYKIT